MIGLGGNTPTLFMYIANRPAGARYQSLNSYEPLLAGELSAIVANNTNHWRKAFNVYAKVLWQLNWPTVQQLPASSWQHYRDTINLAHCRLKRPRLITMILTPTVQPWAKLLLKR